MSITLYIISGFLVHLSIPKRKEIIKLKVNACILWLERNFGNSIHIFYLNNNSLFFIEQDF